MRTRRVLTVAVCLAALAACAPRTGPAQGRALSDEPILISPEPILSIVGQITEIEAGNLSVRATDERQFIFSLDNSPVSEGFLQDRFRELKPVRITYRAHDGRLIPLHIEDAG